MGFLFRIDRQQILHVVAPAGEDASLDLVMEKKTFSHRFDQISVFQDAQMLRNGALGDVKPTRQRADAKRPAAKRRDDAHPRLNAQRSTKTDRLFQLFHFSRNLFKCSLICYNSDRP